MIHSDNVTEPFVRSNLSFNSSTGNLTYLNTTNFASGCKSRNGVWNKCTNCVKVILNDLVLIKCLIFSGFFLLFTILILIIVYASNCDHNPTMSNLHWLTKDGWLDEPNLEEYFKVILFLNNRLGIVYSVLQSEKVHLDTNLGQYCCSQKGHSTSNLTTDKLPKLDNLLTWYDKLNINLLWSITLDIPSKIERSNHFQNIGLHDNKKFKRYARVVLFWGGAKSPKDKQVRIYRVGPLDNPQNITLLDRLPFYKRPLSNIEYGALVDFLSIYLQPLDGILQRVYKASYFQIKPSKYWLFDRNQTTTTTNNKCQSKTNSNLKTGRSDCLMPIFASPIVTDAAPYNRQLWFRLTRQVMHLIQNPVDFQIQIDHTSSDPNHWKVVKIWFQGRYFKSGQHLLNFYLNNAKEIIDRPFVDMYSHYFRPGPNQDASSSNPGYSNEPTSSIRVKERHVTYGNWQFYVTIRRDTGLRIYGVHFVNLSIISEVGLDEIVTAYWGNSPFMQYMTSLESMYGIGALTSELSPGLDCPANAIYLPANIIPSGEVGLRNIEKAICLFESYGQPIEGPSFRHFEYTSSSHDRFTNFGFGSKNPALFVRSVASIYNYDYIFDVVFYASGLIEMSVTPTGFVHVDQYMPVTTWSPSDQHFGFNSITDGKSLIFVIHHHLFHFKLDVDVLGWQNYMKIIEIYGPKNSKSNRKGNYPGNPLNNAQLKPGLWFESKVLQSEQEAKMDVRFDRPKQYLICATNNKSRWENENMSSFCLILVNHNPIKTLFSGEHTKSFAWARHQLHVTQYHDNEPSASSIFNGVDLSSPYVDFTSFSKDDESILNKDIVLWITVGNYHLPRQEDLPNTQTAGGRASFHLMPHNMFAFNPDASECHRVYTKNINQWVSGIHLKDKNCSADPITVIK